MAEGCKPFKLDALVSPKVIAEERAGLADEAGTILVPVAEDALALEDLTGLPVIVVDEAAEYVASLTVTEDFRAKDAPIATTEAFYGVIRPPFDRCFLEFSGRRYGRTPGLRVGWLIEVEDADDAPESAPTWLAEARWFLTMSLLVEAARKGVVFGPCMQHVIPLNRYGEPCSPDGHGPGISEQRPSMSPEPTPGEDLFLRGASLFLAFPAIFGLSLINCKNVDIRPVDPPEPLSRKHSRKHGHPLTRYYVLDIQPMRRILDTEGEAQTKGLTHALHICRGHFKTFTEDAPLFGKRTGTYWWQPQLRGKTEHGVVEKDYRLRLDQGLGREYVEADEHAEIKPSAPEHTGLDPDLGGRGLRAHNLTQNLLAQAVRDAGHEPRRPKPEEPQFDLAWEAGDVTWVAEVKSITPRNEERQLRAALGQVLRYRQLLEEEGRTVQAMIAAEVKPTDPSWNELCAREDITLVWGPDELTVE